MSNIIHYPDAMEAPELQVWNNAAFDDSDGRWSSCLEPDTAFVNRSSDSGFVGKENVSPRVSVKASAKPIRSNTATAPRPEDPEEEEKRIDSEIEAIEREIGRLSSRLEALRIERKSKAAERRRKIINSTKILNLTPANLNQKKKVLIPFGEAPRSVDRRGLSLGPSEIFAGSGLRRLSKLEVTPIQAAQSRRKSCFWKLQEVDELRATKERGKSQSLSPKSRRTAMKTQPPKQPATTATKKSKDDASSIASKIQPKKLFGEKSAAAATTAKRPARPGRVVPSRYNSTAARTSSEAVRKRSLPEEEEEDVKRTEKKRMSLAVAAKSGGNRGKKKWEIPAEVVVFRGGSSAEEEEEESAAVLPKIKTLRWRADESPARDSGPAKRVADLVGRRSYFCPEEEVKDESVCQVLSFCEDEEVLKQV